MSAAIKTHNLTKRYGNQRGIEELTLEVAHGEVFGFLGPNGAGKTTTIRTLLDLLRPTSGTARVLGMDTRRDRAEIHRRVGYLPGEFVAYQNLTGRDYIAYLASLRGGVEKRYVAGLAEALDADIGRRISSLSHGNKQKLGLLQAFMHRPEVLILDEPTQGLDPLVQRQFHDMMSEARAAEQTVFLSSHDLPEVEHVCDRVALVREGRLIEVADVGDLKVRSARKVEIHFARPVPRGAFEGLAGIKDLEVEGDVVRCTVTASMDALVKAAARFDVLDLESVAPGLEEIFLSMYDGPGGHVPQIREASPGAP
jgi:beta-exotoxin I transport system ATP-binding protein